jgi:L-amino acid N-acyltransferase YncA
MQTAMADEQPIWAYMLSSAAAAKAIDVAWQAWLAKRKRKTAASDAIHAAMGIYTAMKLVPADQCQRIVVFKAHNGGKALDARSHKYSSILYEDVRAPFESILQEYQGWLMDSQYLEMLQEVVNKGHATIHTNTMPDGKLKDLYEASGVTLSQVVYLGEDGTNIFYMSFASCNDIERYNAVTRNAMDICTNKIKKHLCG